MSTRVLILLLSVLVLNFSMPVMAQEQKQEQDQDQDAAVAAKEANIKARREREILKKCPRVGAPKISIEQFRGTVMENSERTAFNIAREKSKLYGKKMPIKQGSMGRPVFNLWIDIEMEGYPSLSCIVLTDLKVRLQVDNRIEIASDFDPDSCIYSEFYSLEGELMRQDEEVITEGIGYMRTDLAALYGNGGNAFVMLPGVSVSNMILKQKKAIDDMVRNRFQQIEINAFEERVKSDDPVFFDQIVADCSG